MQNASEWQNPLSRWRQLAARETSSAIDLWGVDLMGSVSGQKQKDNPKDVEKPILPQIHPSGPKEERRAKEKKSRNGERNKKTTIREGG